MASIGRAASFDTNKDSNGMNGEFDEMNLDFNGMTQRAILDHIEEKHRQCRYDSTPSRLKKMYNNHLMKLYNEACAILLNNRTGKDSIGKVFYTWFASDEACYIRSTWNSYKHDPTIVEFAREGARDGNNQHLIDEYISSKTNNFCGPFYNKRHPF